MEICSRMTGMERLGGAFRLSLDAADALVYFLTDEIVRIRVSFDRKFDEESYVLMLTAWEDRLDGLFAGERERVEPVIPDVTQTEQDVVFRTGALALQVNRCPLSFRLTDADGDVLFETVAGNPFLRDRNGRVVAYSRMQEDDCFYGFGEKTGPLNKNKCFLRERATDALAYDPARTDTLYKHIPFYLRLDRSTRKAVGVFWHNFYESEFNQGCEKSNYWPRYTYYRADGGDLDLFLIGGSGIPRVIDNYTRLTGRPALLPKRALGYQGSSMYYPELPERCDEAVLDFVDAVREEGFPIDGFHLSSGYTAVNGKRCVFEWNRTRFSDPAAFFEAMNERGAQVVPNVKPGVLTAHPRYEEFLRRGVFLRASDGGDAAVGSWWGGPGSFWDYTNPAARDVWKEYLTRNVLSMGTQSVWDDNCEYDSLLDLDTPCDFDGKGAPLAALRPLMSNLMCMIGAQAVREHTPGRRPYIVCRAGAAGIQRWAQTWCGDNATSWETLRRNIPTMLGMGLSGQPNEGADVGGFAGPAPGEELFVRWVQHGAFMPRFSIHSASSDNTVTEPWMYHESAGLIRDAIRLRYRLTPYLYSAEYEASRTGAPIMRALVYEFQNDPNVWEEDSVFLFGRDILVANVLEPGARTRSVYLPAGCRWYRWDDKFRAYEGGRTVEFPVGIESVPMFLREGAIVAVSDTELTNMERGRVRALRLVLCPGRAPSEAVVYDDDGVTDVGASLAYRKTHITMQGHDRVEVAFRAEGDFPDPVETVAIEMTAPERAPFGASLDGRSLPRCASRRRFETAEAGWYYSQTNRTVELKYPNPRRDCTLTVFFDPVDLIGM